MKTEDNNRHPPINGVYIRKFNRTVILLFTVIALLDATLATIVYFDVSLAAKLPSVLKMFVVGVGYVYSFLIRLGLAQTSGGLLFSWTDISPAGTLLLIAIVLSTNYLVALLIGNLFNHFAGEELGFYFAIGLSIFGIGWLVISILYANRAVESENLSNATCLAQATAEDNRTDLVGSDAYCYAKCSSEAVPPSYSLPNGQNIGECKEECTDNSKLYDTLYRHCIGEVAETVEISGTTAIYQP